MKRILTYFTKLEIAMWSFSVLLIIGFFLVFDKENYLTLFASLIGVTSLVFCAKGNPIGQALMIVFSVIYAWISYQFSYYGEMLTYLGMTLPMAVIAFVSWMKHPFQEGKAEVKIENLKRWEWIPIVISASVVTIVFYFVLRYFHTANLGISTFSVTTSFLAVYLSFRRSQYFALAYAANDVVLIVMWILASVRDIQYMSVAVCFAVFLTQDLYGFISWRRMKRQQEFQ